MFANQQNKTLKQSGFKLSLLGVALIATLGLAACSKGTPAASGPPAGMAMPVSVVTLEATNVPISAEEVAQTEGASEVEVRPRVGGILLKRLYQEGVPVKAGQPMFLIDPVPYQIALVQAKAQLAQQKARIEQTKREAARLQGLLETQSISQREYDNAVSDNETALATLQQAQAAVHEAELNLSYTTVTAPSSGISGRFQFSEGALVAPNTSLLTTIVQLSPIWVRFSFSDNEIAQLGGRLNQQTIKKISLILPDGSEYKESGKLNFAASQIDPALGTQQLRAAFDNADKTLLPGQFARVRVTTGTRAGVFIIPQTSVMTNDQGKFVYVVNDKNEVTLRPVVVGDWVGTGWVVLEGLKAGEKVVTDNLLKLHLGAFVAPHPAGEEPAKSAATSATAKPDQSVKKI